jgi:ribose 5-phosphate isomerase B
MKIYLGADHNGFALKATLSDFLRRSGYEVFDDGDATLNPEDDFPQFASKVCTEVLREHDTEESRGILICGSGQGMCMVANRFKGIRAAICWNVSEARSARNDDDSNVLCLSAREFSEEATQAIVMTWLNTPFAGATRYKRRIQEMDNL